MSYKMAAAILERKRREQAEKAKSECPDHPEGCRPSTHADELLEAERRTPMHTIANRR